jgi:hypothetical protein
LEEREKITDAVLKNSGSLRELTTSHAVGGQIVIGGNVAYGGQIPDITLTRTTVRLASGMLKKWNLHTTTDFETFNRAIDEKLDDHLRLQTADGHRPLEDLHSDEHKVMDKFDRNKVRVGRVTKADDSRTDLMALFALQTGDCRPTGYLKQLFFDVWQQDHVRNLMSEAYSAGLKGDLHGRDKALSKADELQRSELRTMSARISAPIKMKELYEHVKDPKTGRPVRDATHNDVEDHTFTVLVQYNKDGTIKDDVIAADAFYKKLYPLAGQKLSAKQFMSEQGIQGGHMGVKDSDGKLVPFTMKPTRYSGSLLKEFNVGSTDFRFGGQVVAPPTLGHLINGRKQTAKLAEGIANLVFKEPAKAPETPAATAPVIKPRSQ